MKTLARLLAIVMLVVFVSGCFVPVPLVRGGGYHGGGHYGGHHRSAPMYHRR